MAERSWRRILLRVLFGIGAMLVAVFLLLAFSWGLFSGEPRPWQAGKQATYVDGPLREDGSIDYRAALNEQARQDIALDQNAARWYLDVWETDDYPELIIEEYEISLGWDRNVFPHKFREPSAPWWLEWNSAVDSGYLDGLDQQPVRTWLAEHQPIFEHVEVGSRQASCYIPIVAPPDTLLIATLLGPSQAIRGYAQSFQVRAYLRLLDGDYAGAHQDAMTIRRIARHLGHHPLSIPRLIATALDQVAGTIDQRIFADPTVSADVIEQYRAEIADLPALPRFRKRLTHAERVMALDAVTQIARGKADLDAIDIDLPPMVRRSIDWEVVMIGVNQQYDLLDEIMQIEDVAEREAALQRVEDDLFNFRRHVASRVAQAIFSRKGRSYLMRDIIASMMLPSIPSLLGADAALESHQRLTQLCAALALYRHQTGKYPASLDELVPDYLDQIPEDPEGQTPFTYRLDGESFVLYGTGQNRVDDGGLEDDKVASAPGWLKPAGEDPARQVDDEAPLLEGRGSDAAVIGELVDEPAP